MKNPWSKNGIAIYPPQYPLAGQNRIFNTLHKFKQGFSSEDDMCGFFVVVGDWGLGKTRIGLELIAETTGRMEEWLLAESEYIVPNTHKRILDPQLSEGILPLFIDYKTAIDDDWGSDTWVATVTCKALTLLWDRPKDLRVFSGVLDDLVKVLKAKGIDIITLKELTDSLGDYSDKLNAVMDVLRTKGINYLWVIVDEVETPGDLRKTPEYERGNEIESEELTLIGQVIKEARYRMDHPYVNFLLLCSRGMSDVINIGPNLRRSDLETLEPNNISDVHILQKDLEEGGSSVDYPDGTLESVFIATNRNFGWFNKVMSSIHTSWERHKQVSGQLPSFWALIKEYAQAEARSKEVYNFKIVKTFPDIPEEIQERLIYGQLPINLNKDIDPETAEHLLAAHVPDVGPAFVKLAQIHINEETLANQLVSPEFGFKKVDRAGDDYFNPYTELSISGVLNALRAFSVSVEGDSDFVIYEDPDQFAEQLATLYPRERIDENKSIERAADYLHRIFMRAAVVDQSYIAVSFKLLKMINIRMTSESRSVSFFSDPKLNEEIEKYASEQSSSTTKRISAICQGMAKVLDDSKANFKVSGGAVSEFRYITFNSEIKSPPMEGLDLTRDGQLTVAYCIDVDQGIKNLSTKLGKTGENIHPILVLFGPDGDSDAFDKEAQRHSLVQRSLILRKLTTVEEEFLVKYSGRGIKFDSSAPLSRYTHATLGGLRHDLNNRFSEWRQQKEQSGYVIRPIWFGRVSGKDDFYDGYRYLVAKNESVDGLDPAVCNIRDWETVKLSNFTTAAKKNTDPGKYSTSCLSILEVEPYKPLIPSTMVRVLQEMKSQTGADTLAKKFFFAARDNDVKGDQITQIIEFLEGLGVVVSPSASEYKAIAKNILDERRIISSTWLNTTAEELINNIRNIFPEHAKALEKGFKADAIAELKKAEEIAEKVDFSFLSMEEADPEAFKSLIKYIYQFDHTLRKIAPPDPSQSFDIGEDQIKYYQDQYKTLSFWEKVHFLLWLETKFGEKRDEMIKVIDEQIADAGQDLSLVEGHPFPIAPLTQPLRSINDELQAALTGQIGSMRDYIELTEYNLSISNYLYQSNFDYAWHRLIGLGELVSKSNPDSFWQRFSDLFNKWKEVVNQFSETEKSWTQLDNFMNDAISTKWNATMESIKKKFDALEGQIHGGLKHETDQWIIKINNDELIDKLAQEVAASEARPGDLEINIEALFNLIKEELLLIINDLHLQALNRLLRVGGQEEWHAPGLSNTYSMTKTAFEGFNNQVSGEGRKNLVGKGRKTNWELWVEIYDALDKDNYQKKEGHEAQLQELESLGLIETKIVLT